MVDGDSVVTPELHAEMVNWGHAGKPLADKLRKIATGEIETYEFSPKDWRTDAIPLLLWHAADEIEYLTRDSDG